jgi:hypothetical protein
MIKCGPVQSFLGVISACGSAIGCGGSKSGVWLLISTGPVHGTYAGLREDWGRAGDCICKIAINKE